MNSRSWMRPHLGMRPWVGLVLLEYLIQLSYTDRESCPGALTCEINHTFMSLWEQIFFDPPKRKTAEWTRVTCWEAWNMTFCTDGTPEALSVALAAQ